MSLNALLWVLKQHETTATEVGGPARHLASVMAWKANDEGWLWHGVKSLATMTGFSRVTVMRALEQLEEAGIIAVEKRHRKTSLYRVKVPVDNDGGVVSEIDHPWYQRETTVVSEIDQGGIRDRPQKEQLKQTTKRTTSLCGTETKTAPVDKSTNEDSASVGETTPAERDQVNREGLAAARRRVRRRGSPVGNDGGGG